jgi:CDP-diacylglycerol--serine O-phosphatidyltransferase
VLVLAIFIYALWNFSQPLLLGMSLVYVGSGIAVRIGGILRRTFRGGRPPAPGPAEG